MSPAFYSAEQELIMYNCQPHHVPSAEWVQPSTFPLSQKPLAGGSQFLPESYSCDFKEKSSKAWWLKMVVVVVGVAEYSSWKSQC